MKNKYIVSSLALALLFGCVPDSRDLNMPDSAVYFVDNVVNKGIQSVLMYDVQSEVEAPVHVYCSGLAGGSTNVSAAVSEDYLAYYNEINGTQLKALPAECYSLEGASMAMADRSASFSLNFNVSEVVALSEQEDVNIEDYVVALELSSDKLPVATVKDTTSLGYYLARPDLHSATLKISSTEATPDGKVTITAELPFENSWDLTYDVKFGGDVDKLFTTKGNSIPAKYVFSAFPDDAVIENKDVKSMAAGTNKVEYSIAIPAESLEWTKGKSLNYAVEFSNAVLNGKEIPIENPLHTILYDKAVVIKSANNQTTLGTALQEYGLTPLDDKQGKGRTGALLETIDPDGGFIFHAQTAQANAWGVPYSVSGPFDDKTDHNNWSWMQNWGGNTSGHGGYGATSFKTPYWLLVDMQGEFNVGGIEFWIRPDRYNMKTIEIYALDDCTYTLNQSVLNYDSEDVTYIGLLEFPNRDYNVQSVSVDPIKTRYIMFNITALHGNGLDCQELVFWGY